MIEFSDVSKIYQVGDVEVRALDHVSMRIEDGEFVAIVGPSGSGKSTLMNIIGILDAADEGTYLLDGQAIEDYSNRELTRIRSKKIGFIFQSFNLIGTMTAWENVELPLIYQRVGRRERAERVREALAQVGLSERGDHKPNELSGGQQQRVAIARAIATRPSLFLADEPTGNLDSHTGAEIMELFHRMHAQGNTIVLITHDEGVAAQAGRSIRILDGRIVEGGLAVAAPPSECPDALVLPASPQVDEGDGRVEGGGCQAAGAALDAPSDAPSGSDDGGASSQEASEAEAEKAAKKAKKARKKAEKKAKKAGKKAAKEGEGREKAAGGDEAGSAGLDAAGVTTAAVAAVADGGEGGAR